MLCWFSVGGGVAGRLEMRLMRLVKHNWAQIRKYDLGSHRWESDFSLIYFPKKKVTALFPCSLLVLSNLIELVYCKFGYRLFA